MATKDEATKTLEARVAELEDKLAQVSITEEEMQTYQKVAAALGQGAAPPTSAAAAQPATAQAQAVLCYRHWGYHLHRHWSVCWIHQVCYECGAGGPGGAGPDSFGGFGR